MTIIAGIRGRRETRIVRTVEGAAVEKFEKFGRQVDRELEKLQSVVEKEIKPATKRKAAAVLRQVSVRLANLADEIEARPVEKQP
jgi:hypothetical protein